VKQPGNTPPRYVELAPPPELRPFVDYLWVHRVEGPPPEGGRRLLPDGRLHLVWIGGLGVQIAGPQTTYGRPANLREIVALGAGFRPGAAARLLRMPTAEFVDEHVPLDAVLPGLAARLDDRLSHATEPRQAVAAFAGELVKNLRHADAPDPAVRHAIGLLDRATTTVAEVAERAFVSERQLERRFTELVGYGPKTLQRILRFQRFLAQVALPDVGLAGAAALAGYADQAHLSRETRRLAGLTPRQLRHYEH
jgi:AraC-like DNA-binding protein